MAKVLKGKEAAEWIAKNEKKGFKVRNDGGTGIAGRKDTRGILGTIDSLGSSLLGAPDNFLTTSAEVGNVIANDGLGAILDPRKINSEAMFMDDTNFEKFKDSPLLQVAKGYASGLSTVMPAAGTSLLGTIVRGGAAGGLSSFGESERGNELQSTLLGTVAGGGTAGALNLAGKGVKYLSNKGNPIDDVLSEVGGEGGKVSGQLPGINQVDNLPPRQSTINFSESGLADRDKVITALAEVNPEQARVFQRRLMPLNKDAKGTLLNQIDEQVNAMDEAYRASGELIKKRAQLPTGVMKTDDQLMASILGSNPVNKRINMINRLDESLKPQAYQELLQATPIDDPLRGTITTTARLNGVDITKPIPIQTATMATPTTPLTRQKLVDNLGDETLAKGNSFDINKLNSQQKYKVRQQFKDLGFTTNTKTVRLGQVSKGVDNDINTVMNALKTYDLPTNQTGVDELVSRLGQDRENLVLQAMDSRSLQVNSDNILKQASVFVDRNANTGGLNTLTSKTDIVKENLNKFVQESIDPVTGRAKKQVLNAGNLFDIVNDDAYKSASRKVAQTADLVKPDMAAKAAIYDYANDSLKRIPGYAEINKTYSSLYNQLPNMARKQKEGVFDGLIGKAPGILGTGIDPAPLISIGRKQIFDRAIGGIGDLRAGQIPGKEAVANVLGRGANVLGGGANVLDNLLNNSTVMKTSQYLAPRIAANQFQPQQADAMGNMGNMGGMGGMGDMGNMGDMGSMGNMGDMGDMGDMGGYGTELSSMYGGGQQHSQGGLGMLGTPQGKQMLAMAVLSGEIEPAQANLVMNLLGTQDQGSQMTAGQQDKMGSLDFQLANLDEIETMINADGNQFGSTNILGRIADKIGGPLADKDRASTATRLNFATSQLVNELSGAGASDRERSYIQNMLPGINDEPEVALAKLNSVRNTLKLKRQQKYGEQQQQDISTLYAQ